MKKIIALILSAFLLSITSFAKSEAYPIEISEIKRDFNHNSVKRSDFVQGVSKYIYENMRENNSKGDAKNRSYHSFTDKELKEEAIKISSLAFLASEVYKVNPYIVIAIMKKESEFDSKRISKWKSKKTGNWIIAGTGLTSFVDPGIKEILQQFQLITNPDNKTEVANHWKYLYESYREKVIFEKVGNLPSFSEFELSLDHLEKNSSKYKIVKEDFLLVYPAMATMFTAMYLKILLKAVCKNLGSCESHIIDYKENPNMSLKSQINRYYGLASQRYNGNGELYFLNNCKTVAKKGHATKTVKECYKEHIIKTYQKIEAYSKGYANVVSTQLKNFGVVKEAQQMILGNYLLKNVNLEGKIVNDNFLELINYQGKGKYDSQVAYDFCSQGKSVFISDTKEYKMKLGSELRLDFRIDHLNCSSILAGKSLSGNWAGVSVSIMYDVIDRVLEGVNIDNVENWRSFLNTSAKPCSTPIVESKSFALLEALLYVDDSIVEVKGRDNLEWEFELDCSPYPSEHTLRFTPIRFRRESDNKSFELTYEFILNEAMNLQSIQRVY